MAFATVHGWLADLPVGASVEAVAPYVNTFFLVIAIVVCPWMLRRRLGNLGAVGLSCGMIGVHSFYQLFMVGYIDHHGAIAMASLFCVLLVAAGGAGWTVATPSDELLFRESRLVTPKKRSNRRSGGTALSKAGQNIETIERPIAFQAARRYFVASGLAGSIALWTSAATTVPVLVEIGLGKRTGFLLERPAPTGSFTGRSINHLGDVSGPVANDGQLHVDCCDSIDASRVFLASRTSALGNLPVGRRSSLGRSPAGSQSSAPDA